jgi:hypothetical protein
MDGASIANDVTNAGAFSITNGATIGRNFTTIGNGQLIVPHYGLELKRPPATIKGKLSFQGSSTQLISHVASEEFEAAMIEVSGTAGLNNVTVNVIGDFARLVPGTYGLLQAGGGITGTPTAGTLPSGGTLKVNGNRLDLVVA